MSNQNSLPVFRFPPSLISLVCSAADAVASHHVFADYQQRKAASTRSAHDDDLATFALLADAGVHAGNDG